jgi:hypothetical protein
MCALRCIVCDLYILLNNIELRALLVHHMRHVAEQLVEFTDRLLDIANLGLALDDEGFLEVDFVLVGEAQLLLLLLVAEVAALVAGRCDVLKCGAGCLRRSLFFFQSLLLEVLEFRERGFEFALEFGLGELLRGLACGLLDVDYLSAGG